MEKKSTGELWQREESKEGRTRVDLGGRSKKENPRAFWGTREMSTQGTVGLGGPTSGPAMHGTPSGEWRCRMPRGSMARERWRGGGCFTCVCSQQCRSNALAQEPGAQVGGGVARRNAPRRLERLEGKGESFGRGEKKSWNGMDTGERRSSRQGRGLEMFHGLGDFERMAERRQRDGC